MLNIDYCNNSSLAGLSTVALMPQTPSLQTGSKSAWYSQFNCIDYQFTVASSSNRVIIHHVHCVNYPLHIWRSLFSQSVLADHDLTNVSSTYFSLSQLPLTFGERAFSPTGPVGGPVPVEEGTNNAVFMHPVNRAW